MSVTLPDRNAAAPLWTRIVLALFTSMSTWWAKSMYTYVGPRWRSRQPLSDARAGRRFQPHPFDEGAGNMQQSHVTYSSKIMGGAAAHG